MARSELRPSGTAAASSPQYKDAILDELAEVGNVAQFVSFAPGLQPQLRFVRLRDLHEQKVSSIDDAISALMERSVQRSVNVRSFHPDNPKANEFIYGLTDIDAVAHAVRRLAKQGLYTIVNETIDVKDGGVSGVSYGGILEFAPGDTPRAVEKPGTVSLRHEMGLRMLTTVYGFQPELPFPPDVRVEFSIHPLRRGVRQTHTIIWELESTDDIELRANTTWPNLFSRHLGDKTFGLLVADAIGLPVPATIVVGRNVAPFRFGRSTGTGERWIRTSPAEQTPGRFTTRRGWTDPFVLMSTEDPQGNLIASVLDQEGVDAQYSGAAIAQPDGKPAIEGVSGYGDAFMQGAVAPQRLPPGVTRKVTTIFNSVVTQLGPVRFEWVVDKRRVWIVQLHRGATLTSGGTIYPGNPTVEHRFAVEGGLDALRAFIDNLPRDQDNGIVLVGHVGVTSHFGDLLRRARIPSRVETP